MWFFKFKKLHYKKQIKHTPHHTPTAQTPTHTHLHNIASFCVLCCFFLKYSKIQSSFQEKSSASKKEWIKFEISKMEKTWKTKLICLEMTLNDSCIKGGCDVLKIWVTYSPSRRRRGKEDFSTKTTVFQTTKLRPPLMSQVCLRFLPVASGLRHILSTLSKVNNWRCWTVVLVVRPTRTKWNETSLF